MDRTAHRIVAAAEDCARRYTARSALEVIDMAMSGHRGSAPDFSDDNVPYGTHLHPLMPFGHLLGEAFALGLPPHSVNEEWRSEVLDRFARRYGLRQRNPATCPSRPEP